MTATTFNSLVKGGLASDKGAIDDLYVGLVDALELYIEKRGADCLVRISIVVMDEKVAAEEDKTADGELEYGVAYSLCDDNNRPLGVQVDICTMSPAALSDQGDEDEEVSSED